MKVIRARVLGFCMGVRRAVDMALSVSSDPARAGSVPAEVYTFGPLIHNKRVLQMLQKQGVICLEVDNLKKTISHVSKN